MSLIVFVIGMLLIVIPMWKITERAGFNPLWALVCIVPLGLIVLLWVLAYRPRAGV